jgi:GcrA cell cycle regulator
MKVRIAPGCHMPARALNADDLRRLAGAGYTAADIAAITGFVAKTVMRVAHAHGISLHRNEQRSEFWSQHDEELRRLKAEGMSASQIAARLGTTKNAVIGRLYRTREDMPAVRRQLEFPPSGCCVWLFGDPGDAGFHWCGDPAAGLGLPYCARHMRAAYRPARTPALLEVAE